MESPDDLRHTGYWRGRIDTRLDHIESTMQALSIQVEHMHICVEKRTRLLYLYAGGLGVILALLQLFGPVVVKALFK